MFGMCTYVFILCLRCPVFRYRPCDELITRPSPTVYKMNKMKKYNLDSVRYERNELSKYGSFNSAYAARDGSMN
jgi:hypothetical protein